MRIIQNLSFSRFLYLAILLAFMVWLPAPGAAETEPLLSPEKSDSVKSLLGGLSDEQVRQMLITELQKDAMEDQYTSQQQHMAGPAGLFNYLLQKISGEHDDKEKQIRELWSTIPQVIPDLHKVFLNL